MRSSLTPLELGIVILSIALSTFLTRAGILLLGERLVLSPRLDAALRFAPVCALTALVVPEVLYPEGVLDLSSGNARLPAAIAAGLLLLWRPSITWCIVVGMAVYAAARLL